MCYRGDGAVLDLDGVHLACLSGDNGSGKSALLAAITWALWGRARDRVLDDELISHGASEMEVDYEFILGSVRYRVVRKRAKKGSSGTTILDIFICTDDAGTWKPLTGHHVRDTQAKITDLLKMEYETFINSAFILQGRADEFTVKQPTERKKVLTDILGLSEYDRLEERAKEEARDRKSRMMELDGQTNHIEAELRQGPEHARQLQSVEASLKEKQAELSTTREELHALQRRHQELQTSKQRLVDLQARRRRREAEIENVQERFGQNSARKGELEALLAQSAEIKKGYAELQAAQAEERRLGESRNTLQALRLEQGRIEHAIDRERSTLSVTVDGHKRQISDLERKLAGQDTVERQLSAVLEKLATLERLQEQHEDTKCQRENLDLKVRTLVADRESLEKEGKQLRQKLDMIMEAHAEGKGHADCPLCGTGLTADALERVQRSYNDDITEKRSEYNRKSKELEATNKEMVKVMERIEKEREQLKALPMEQKRRAQYDAELLQMADNRKKMEQEQGLLVVISTQLAESDYAHEERKQLQQIEAQIKKNDYDEAAHAVVRTRLSDLEAEGYNKRFHDLENAGSRLEQVLEYIEADHASLALLREEQESDLVEITTLQPQVELLQEVEGQVAEKKTLESELNGEVQELIGTQGELRGKIERCDILKKEKQALMEQYKAANEERAIFEELATAFGKKGIQAMVIENIIPELEEEANTILHRMTDGRMNVQLATQRDARNNKSVIETLDINISDEMGTRKYELYSGGEAFRANFAIRIALSKLLARRAGAQLQLLVIDEGFGTQDGQGRDRLVSAIRSIQDDFAKIIVVTHIEELKGEFPVRIDVVKTESGSMLVTNDR